MWSDNELRVCVHREGWEVGEPVLTLITGRVQSLVSVYFDIQREEEHYELKLEITPENLRHVALRLASESERLKKELEFEKQPLCKSRYYPRCNEIKRILGL